MPVPPVLQVGVIPFEFGNGIDFIEIVFHIGLLLLSDKLFEGSVSIRQPDFVDVVQHLITRPVVVFTIALQHLMILQRIFHSDKRSVRLLLCTDKEDQRLLAYDAHIVIHSPYAMV